MNKIEEIFKAWRISFNPNEEQSDIAAKRIEICDACEFKDVVEVGPLEIFTRCKVCGCALKAKMFTPATYRDPGGSCPHGKWMEVEKIWLEQKEQRLLTPEPVEEVVEVVEESSAEIPIELSTLLSSNLPVTPVEEKFSSISATNVTTIAIK